MRLFHGLISVAVTGVCMVSLFSGCAKAPDQELAAAKAAIKAAQDVEADTYMPNNFTNVQKAMEAAEMELAQQNSAFALSRKYTRARLLLKNAQDLATQIAADAPGAKDELKKQVEEGLVSAQDMAKETRVDIKKAPKSKGKQALAKMASDLDVAEGSIAKASEEFTAGNILEAQKNLADAHRLMKKIFDQLSSSGTGGLM